MVGKKLKDKFNEFMNTDKSAYKTFKPILQNRNLVQPDLNCGFVIHTYQFMRFIGITCYSNKMDLTVIDDTFILYCLKVLGTRDNIGRHHEKNDDEYQPLLRREKKKNIDEYQSLLNHEKTNLKNETFLLPYLATQINISKYEIYTFIILYTPFNGVNI